MEREHQIVKQIYAAREDREKADELIRSYIPFIRSEVSRFLSRVCTEQDDEYSIGMIAFYEAIMGYERDRGKFLSYASVLIKNRLIDYVRKEARHQGTLSLEAEQGDGEERTLGEQLADKRDMFEEAAGLEATRQEIEELSTVMAGFGVSFSDAAEYSPRQERTMEACLEAIRCGGQDKELLQELLRTKKLSVNRLASQSGVPRKTLERHRKYILVMLLIQTNGYELMRGHLYRILKKKGDRPE